jgi:CubicO group peptidase (beta-lactamase class C family)
MHGSSWRTTLAILMVTVAGVAALLASERSASELSHLLPEEATEPAAADQPTFTPEFVDTVIRPVADEIAARAFPGATIAMGVRDEEFHLVGVGAVGWTRNAAPADPVATIYDLASLTKVVATASAIMLLVDEGKLDLDEPISRFFPDFREGAKSRVTTRHLLTHTSGVPAGATLRGNNRRERIARAASFPIYPPAGARVEYSDVGFILLGELVERAAGEPIAQYLERKLFRPLGMTSTRYSPGLDCESCAPTGRLRDQSLYRGRPFDPLAQRLDGVSGHSGLFSTASDLGRFAAMIANEGEFEGVRVIRAETVREFTREQPVGGRYRLAWEVYCDPQPTDANERCVRPVAIGHSGWTGTSLWIQPETGLWVVLLTNRTYEPRAPNRIQQIRRELFSRAAGGRTLPIAMPEAIDPSRSVAGGTQPGDFSPIPPPAED